MGYARYIGRVGALAIALGVGAAVAGGHGIAWADTTGSAPSDTSDTSSPPSGDTGAAAPTAVDTSTPAGSPKKPKKAPPKVLITNSSGAQTTSRPDQDAADQTVGVDAQAGTAASVRPPDTPAQQVPEAAPDTAPSAPDTPVAVAAPRPQPSSQPVSEPRRSEITPASIYRAPATRSAPKDDAQLPTGSSAIVTDTPKAQSGAVDDRAAAAQSVAKPVVLQTLTSLPAIGTTATRPDPTSLGSVGNIVLGTLGVAPLPGTDTPVDPPAAPLSAVLALAVVRRQQQEALFTQAPGTNGESTDISLVEGTTATDVDAQTAPRAADTASSTDAVSMLAATKVGPLAKPVKPPKPPKGPKKNQAPVAGNDTATTAEDTAVAINVLANDSDPNTGDTLTPALVTQPGNGTLAATATGWNYTPNANFNGADFFTYRVSDGTTTSNTATVSIIVTPSNDAPKAVDDSASTDEDTPVTIPAPGLLANDSDVEGSALTAALMSHPAHGTVAVNADGSFTYIPEPDYSGEDSFTYKANDGTADSHTATVSITVNDVPDVPHIVGEPFDSSPYGTVYNNDRSLAFETVTLGIGDGPGDYTTRINVIDVATGEPVGDPITIAGASGGQLILNESGTLGYQVTYLGDGWQSSDFTTRVTVIDAATGLVVGETGAIAGRASSTYLSWIPDQDSPGTSSGVGFSPDGLRAFVTTIEDTGDGAFTMHVTMIDNTSGDVIGSDQMTYAGAAGPTWSNSGYLSPSDGRIILQTYRSVNNSYYYEYTVAIIDSVTGQFVGQGVYSGGIPQFNPTGDRMYLVTSEELDIWSHTTEIRIVNLTTGDLTTNPIVLTGKPKFGATLVTNNDETVGLYLTEESFSGPTVHTIDLVNGVELGDPLYTSHYSLDGLRVNDQHTLAFLVTEDLYAPGGGSQTWLRTFDLSTGQVIGSPLIVDGNAVRGGSFTVEGNRAYLLAPGFNVGDPGTLTIIDTGTGAVVGEPIVFAGTPYRTRLALNDDRSLAFLTTEHVVGDTTTTSITVIDTETTSLVPGSPIMSPGENYGTSFSRDGKLAIATTYVQTADHQDFTYLTFIDSTTGAALGDQVVVDGTVGSIYGSGMTFAPNGTFGLQTLNIYDPVTNTYVQHVAVIDLVNHRLVGHPIAVSGFNGDLNFDTDQSTVYVRSTKTSQGSYETMITAIDTATGEPIGAPIALDGSYSSFGSGYNPLIIREDLHRAFQMTRVETWDGNNYSYSAVLAIIDTDDMSLVGGSPITFDGLTSGQAVITPSGDRVYITNSNYVNGHYVAPSLYLINTSDGSLVGGGPIALPGRPTGSVVLNSDGSRAYQTVLVTDEVTGALSTAVVIVNTADGETVGTEPLTMDGGPIGSVWLNADGSLAYQKVWVPRPDLGQYSYSYYLYVIDTGQKTGVV